MKRILFALVIVLTAQGSFAQDPTDALRYSFLTGEGGTARNQALGGAGASLGGEFTSLFLNPAGLGFYKTGDFIFSPSLLMNSNEAHYLGKTSYADGQKLGIGASGILFSTEYVNRKIKSVTLGIGVNKSANFNNNIYYQGSNKTSSYSEKFIEELRRDNATDVNTIANAYPYGASMAFNTYLINPVTDAGGNITDFFTLADPAMGLRQTMNKTTSGGITDIAIGVGANHENRFFFGGTVTVPMLKYKREAIYREEDESGASNNDFAFFEADEILETKGVGINLKLGVMYKPSDDLQVGLSFFTPTFYQMTDLYDMAITTDPEGFEGQGTLTQNSAYLNNDNFLRATYNMVTPLRTILSGTYFFGTGEMMAQQKGFITADIEYVNYKGSNFLDANNDQAYKDYYRELNGIIDNLYKGALNARIGGELKLNTVMLRLGGAYYGNPYQNEQTDLFKISGGIGYRYRGFYVDLAYTHGIHNTVEYPYRLDRVNVPPALLNNAASNLALTFGFKLY